MDKKIFGITILIIFISIQDISCNVRWPCTSNVNCSTVETATCSLSNNCQCPAGYTFSADVTKCIEESLYGDPCQESGQCSHMLTGSECKNSICTCAEEYSYGRGKCIKLVELGSPCDENIDCAINSDRESVICSDNICACAEGFYKRTDNVCRRISLNVNDTCVVNEDCQSPNLVCEQKKNICVETASIGVQTSIENDINYKNTGAIKKIPKLKNLRKFKIKAKSFGDTCEEDKKPCAGLDYSVCRDGLCHCKPGYYLEDEKCKAEIGEEVTSKEYCNEEVRGIPGQERCLCPKNTFNHPGLRTCMKLTQGIKTGCRENIQCSPYGLSYCTTTSPKQCDCHPYAKYDPERQLCVPIKDSLGQFCLKNEDCIALKNTICSTQKTCVCAQNYITIDETCKPGENLPCENDDECAFNDSQCIPAEQRLLEESDEEEEEEKKICKCKEGFTYHKENCHVKATKYEDKCTISEQCTPLLGEDSKCDENKCVCEENAHYRYEKCIEKKELGERCKTSGECFVNEDIEKVECRNAICQCKLDSSADKDTQRCVVRPTQKNSSGRPSALKIITIVLTTAAVLITSAALREAYYLR